MSGIDGDEHRRKRPPCLPGQTYGKLTVIEVRGDKAHCQCSCGSPVIRDTSNMKAAVATAQVPQCKKCMKQARKGKPDTRFGRRPPGFVLSPLTRPEPLD